MSRADLSGVLLKINRAKTHLNDFDRRAERIKEACKKAIVRELDEQCSEYVFRFNRVPAVPPVLSAIIGDAIHNLRVSLDHLAWQLVIASGGRPNKTTTFPIHKVPPTPNRDGRVRVQISPGVSEELEHILEELQPYKRVKPAHHQLAVLHQLDITDKHRELLIAILGVESVTWWGDHDITAFNTGPYDDGSEVCRSPYSSTSGQDQFNLFIEFSVRLSDSAAGPWRKTLGAPDIVRQSLRYIEEEVLPRFQSYF